MCTCFSPEEAISSSGWETIREGLDTTQEVLYQIKYIVKAADMEAGIEAVARG